MSAIEEKPALLSRLLVLLLLVGQGATAGCSNGAPEPPSPPTSETPTSWDDVLGQRLRSVETHAGGLGPDGQLWEHQYLTLAESGDSFEWLTADIAVSGTLRRSGTHVFARADGREFEGELVRERGILIWDGVEFELP